MTSNEDQVSDHDNDEEQETDTTNENSDKKPDDKKPGATLEEINKHLNKLKNMNDSKKLNERITPGGVVRMYSEEMSIEPILQIGGFKIIDHKPLRYGATLKDRSKMMKVVLHVDYTEPIKRQILQDCMVIQVKRWQMVGVQFQQWAQIDDCEILGMIPEIQLPKTAEIMYYNVQGLAKQMKYNPNIEKNMNKTFTINAVDPLLPFQTPLQRAQQRANATSGAGYGAHRSAFTSSNTTSANNNNNNNNNNNIGSLLSNDEMVATTGLTAEAEATIRNMVGANNSNSNSNSNSNTNSNNDSDTKMDGNDASAFAGGDWTEMLKNMAAGNGVPNQTHDNAPADRNAGLKRGLNEFVLPQLKNKGAITGDQYHFLMQLIDGQNQNLLSQPSSQKPRFNIQQLLREQNDDTLKKIS